MATTSPVSVALVSPPTEALCGETVALTAQVNGSTSTTLTWSVDGVPNGNSDSGTIAGSGTLVTYTAPASEGTHVVTVASTTDQTKFTSTSMHIRRAVTLAAPVLSAPSTALVGSTGLTASLTNPQSKVSYTWSVAGGTIQGSLTGTSVTFSAPQVGSLALTCLAALNGQSLSTTAYVQVQGTPPNSPQIIAPTSVSVSASGLSASVATPEGDTNYAWTLTGGTLTAGASTPSTTFNAGAAGTMVLTCKASNTVGSSSAQAAIQVVPLAPSPFVITAPSQVNAQSSSNLATVPTQSGCTYSWTITGGTLGTGQGTPSITFQAGSTASLLLGCTLTNSVLVGASAQQTIAIIPAPPTPTPTAGYYGSGINGDDIANIVVGWNTANDNCNRVTSYRMRATHTGNLKSIRPFFIWSTAKPGYNLGNGGDIQIQIQTDDGTSNHFPSGTTLASMVDYAPVPVPIPASGNNYYPLLTFSSPAHLTEGQLYHIVFTNVAADPKANYVSLDCLWMWSGNTPEQPTRPNLDMEILEKSSSGAWMKYVRGAGTSITPCIELDYDDGASQGQGYLGAFGDPSTSFENPKPITGAKSVRETFTVSGSNRVVTSASVRVHYFSGPSPLAVRVERADGTLVGESSVNNVPVSPGHNGASWAKVQFASPLTLVAGQTYHLVLSAPADSIYKTHTLFKSLTSGYKSTTYFGDGHAEFNDGTGWKGWDAWGIPNRLDQDLQFYFQTQ